MAVFEGVGHFGPKFQVEGDIPQRPHQPFFVSEKVHEFSFHMVCKNIGRTFVRFVTIHACDGQTDGRTACSPVKMKAMKTHMSFAEGVATGSCPLRDENRHTWGQSQSNRKEQVAQLSQRNRAEHGRI